MCVCPVNTHTHTHTHTSHVYVFPVTRQITGDGISFLCSWFICLFVRGGGAHVIFSFSHHCRHRQRDPNLSLLYVSYKQIVWTQTENKHERCPASISSTSSRRKKIVPLWNCSQRALWIIFSNQVRISTVEFLKCIFISLALSTSSWVLSSFIILKRKKADICKTLQLAPKQSRRINNTTGQRKKDVFDSHFFKNMDDFKLNRCRSSVHAGPERGGRCKAQHAYSTGERCPWAKHWTANCCGCDAAADLMALTTLHTLH